jgi:acyl-coenzyme A thioesterase PaaI-like protein
VRAITAETGRVLAEGRVIHSGKTVATVEASLRSAEGGALLAHGTSTCLIR